MNNKFVLQKKATKTFEKKCFAKFGVCKNCNFFWKRSNEKKCLIFYSKNKILSRNWMGTISPPFSLRPPFHVKNVCAHNFFWTFKQWFVSSSNPSLNSTSPTSSSSSISSQKKENHEKRKRLNKEPPDEQQATKNAWNYYFFFRGGTQTNMEVHDFVCFFFLRLP